MNTFGNRKSCRNWNCLLTGITDPQERQLEVEEMGVRLQELAANQINETTIISLSSIHNKTKHNYVHYKII